MNTRCSRLLHRSVVPGLAIPTPGNRLRQGSLAGIVVALVIATAGCGGGRGAVRRTTLPGGTVLVENLARGTTDWLAVEEFRIGGSGEDGGFSFGEVTDIEVDSVGRIFVFDVQEQSIAVFDTGGTFLERVGRTGRGPGEFIGGEVFGALPDGRLVVADPRTRRFTVFDHDLRFVETVARPYLGATIAPRLLADGRILDWALGFPDERGAVVAGPRVHHTPTIVDPSDGRVDSLPLIELRQEMLQDQVRPQIFHRTRALIRVVSDSILWFVTTRDLRLHQRTLRGDTTLIVTLEVAAAPVSEADRAAIRQRFATQPSLAEAYLEALALHRPAIVSFEADEIGRLFIATDLEGEIAGATLEVFEASGVHAGRVRLPFPVAVHNAPFAVRGDRLHVAAVDDDGVPFVARLRLVDASAR